VCRPEIVVRRAASQTDEGRWGILGPGSRPAGFYIALSHVAQSEERIFLFRVRGHPRPQNDHEQRSLICHCSPRQQPFRTFSKYAQASARFPVWNSATTCAPCER
jgi:hypothetical protein